MGLAELVLLGAKDQRERPLVAVAITEAMYRGGGETVCWGPIVAAGYRAGSTHSTFNGYELQKG